MAFGPKAAWFVGAGTDHRVRLRRRHDAKLLHVFEGHEASVKTVAVRAKDGLIASGDEAGWLRIWRPKARKLVRAVRISEKRVRELHFGPSGTLWITDGADRVLRLPDPVLDAPVVVAEADPAHHDLVTTPDGKRLIVGGGHGVVRIHDARTFETLHTLDTSYAVADLALHPDGRRMAVAHVNGSVGVWDLARRIRLAWREVHEEQIFAIRWLPGDRTLIATGAADGTLRLLDATAAAMPETSLAQRVLEALRRRYPKQAERWTALGRRHADAIAELGSLRAERAAAFAMLADVPVNHLSLHDRKTVAYFVEELKGGDPDSLGLYLVQIGDALHVRRVLAGGPAARAGIRRGDRIHTVDGIPIADSPRRSWRTDDAPLPDRPAYVLHGKAGEQVVLSVSSRADETREIKLTFAAWGSLRGDRAAVRVVERDGSRIGVVPLSYMYAAGGSRMVGEALRGPLAGCDALVLDIRGRGGSPIAVWAVQALFDPKKPKPVWTKPVAVIVDRDTRSAKEVLGHWFQRSKRARVYGETTAGAILPSTFVRLDRWTSMLAPLPPLRLKPQAPVVPDVLVEDRLAYAAGADPILERAIEALRAK